MEHISFCPYRANVYDNVAFVQTTEPRVFRAKPKYVDLKRIKQGLDDEDSDQNSENEAIGKNQVQLHLNTANICRST